MARPAGAHRHRRRGARGDRCGRQGGARALRLLARSRGDPRRLLCDRLLHRLGAARPRRVRAGCDDSRCDSNGPGEVGDRLLSLPRGACRVGDRLSLHARWLDRRRPGPAAAGVRRERAVQAAGAGRLHVSENAAVRRSDDEPGRRARAGCATALELAARAWGSARRNAGVHRLEGRLHIPGGGRRRRAARRHPLGHIARRSLQALVLARCRSSDAGGRDGRVWSAAR